MAFKDDHVNFDKLESEIHKAVEQDARYSRENDAKFRAVGQRCETYEEFRDIVLAAHLKPLEKGDKITPGDRFTQPWNIHADRNTDALGSSGTLEQKKWTKIPENAHKFTQDWRRYCTSKQDKYSFLMWIGPEKLGHIFNMEVSLLGDFFEALLEYNMTDLHQVVDTLVVFSQAKRFGLSVTFLGSGEKENCKKIFEKLQTDLESEGDSEYLEKITKAKSKYELK
ncbi:unnamed protein product [Owenia fusiformis]|uniref:Uncharacterized protein n=1 Tax=Owenia fusiformis TaxID=6347 RepID=A0A8J1TIJ8_OWEFU|nr:unnamed protein product [Owenia fusiformis]